MKKALKLFLVLAMVCNTCVVVSARDASYEEGGPNYIEEEVIDPAEAASATILPPFEGEIPATVEEAEAQYGVMMASAALIEDGSVPGLDDPTAYWDQRKTFEELEALYDALADNYPNLVKKYSIGHSWFERNLWCMEVTSPSGAEGKAPMGIFANIHGGEQESADTASYLLWWLTTQYGIDAEATRVLDNYLIYFVPVINPDGHAHSTLSGYSTRQNGRPYVRTKYILDGNGQRAKDQWGRDITYTDAAPFMDPYSDLNGDGHIGTLYRGTNAETPPSATTANSIGREGVDGNNDGITGADPRYSNIDMNRTFDHMYHRYDVEVSNIGANTWTSAGPDAASEPEIKAVQNFLIAHPVNALITGHTGIQCILYPWCWTPEPSKDDAHFDAVAKAMKAAFESETVPVRGPQATYYTMKSNFDYPTSAEMIDWAYGRLGIHAYTVEVYRGSTGANGWQGSYQANPEYANTENTWQYMGRMTSRNGNVLLGDHVWLYTTRAQKGLCKIAPPDQSAMCRGFAKAAIAMFDAEKDYELPAVPEYLKWEAGLWY